MSNSFCIHWPTSSKVRSSNNNEDNWIEEFWERVLQNEGISFSGLNPKWLDRPAMMKIPVTSPAVLGRLKKFVKPYDFVLAPIVNDVDLDEQTEKPILVTRFTKKSEEWLNATYYNVRTGKTCRVTLPFPPSHIPHTRPRSILHSAPHSAHAPTPARPAPGLPHASSPARLPLTAHARASPGPKPAAGAGGGVAEFFPKCITPAPV